MNSSPDDLRASTHAADQQVPGQPVALGEPIEVLRFGRVGKFPFCVWDEVLESGLTEDGERLVSGHGRFAAAHGLTLRGWCW